MSETAEPSLTDAGEPGTPRASRRSVLSRFTRLLSWTAAGWSAFTASCAASVLETVRFLYPNALPEPPSEFKIGTPDQFAEGEVSDRWLKEHGVWIVRANGKLFALRAACTHLGCTVDWMPAERIFKCPCHGSGFKMDGVNFEGPAPRPLERCAVALAEDGQVVVNKAKLLRRELGQWNEENGAFLRLS